jgi:hypothetical protein
VRAVGAASKLHDGVELRQAVAHIVCQLPRGPVTLIATSIEGAALAAACAADELNHQVDWQLVNPMWEYQIGGTIIGVAPCDPGEGWKSALRTRFPDVTFAFPELGADSGGKDQLTANSTPLGPLQLPGLNRDRQQAKKTRTSS